MRPFAYLSLLIILSPVSAAADPASVSKHQVSHQRPVYFVVSIGVDQYEDKFWPDLRWAAADARAVGSEIGRDTEMQRSVTVLVNQEAGKAKILQAISAIARRARPQDIVMVYISGHGTLMAGSGGDLEPVVVLSETKPNRLSQSGLPQRELMERMKSVKARRKLLVYATCHSGLGKSRLPDHVREALAGAKGRVTDLTKVSEGTIVLAAAAKGETAREDRKLGGDIYTHFFLQALSLYDRDRDGQVSALEAHDFAKERTYRFTNGKQRPTAQAELIGAGDIPLSGRRKQEGLPILEGYDELYAGYEVRVNKGQKGRLPLAFPMDPGTNQVEIFSEGAEQPVATFAVNARRGEAVQVDELFEGPPFAVGLMLTYKSYADDNFRKIYGSSSALAVGLRARGQWRGYQAGVFYVLPTEGEAEVWSGLKSEVTQTYYGVTLGYRHDWWFGLGAGGYAILGQDQSKLTFKDTSTGTSVSESTQALFYGVGAQLQYRVGPYIALLHELEYHWLDYDFGVFGTVPGDRLVGQFGVSYIFGSRARRIK